MIMLEQVVNNILNAFEDTVIPSVEDIFMDGVDLYPEYSQILKLLSDKKWNDLSVEDLHIVEDGIYSFTPRAFVYYLPAFLLRTLEMFESEDMLSETTLSILRPPNSTYIDLFNRRIQEMTLKQKRAVKHFLQYLLRQFPEYFVDEDAKTFTFWQIHSNKLFR